MVFKSPIYTLLTYFFIFRLFLCKYSFIYHLNKSYFVIKFLLNPRRNKKYLYIDTSVLDSLNKRDI